MKKYKFAIKLLLVSFFLFLAFCVLIFVGYGLDEHEYCLDTSYCKEGISINTEHGKITVNKVNCLKYNWKWLEDKKACILK